ncbi:hypothetical protein PC116_g25950, partial [Phytophthora cactorum]
MQSWEPREATMLAEGDSDKMPAL